MIYDDVKIKQKYKLLFAGSIFPRHDVDHDFSTNVFHEIQKTIRCESHRERIN